MVPVAGSSRGSIRSSSSKRFRLFVFAVTVVMAVGVFVIVLLLSLSARVVAACVTLEAKVHSLCSQT